ncbi:hypothetical protein Tco_0738235 [Tanacetum coccineum]
MGKSILNMWYQSGLLLISRSTRFLGVVFLNKKVRVSGSLVYGDLVKLGKGGWRLNVYLSTSFGELPKGVMMNPSSTNTGVKSSCSSAESRSDSVLGSNDLLRNPNIGSLVAGALSIYLSDWWRRHEHEAQIIGLHEGFVQCCCVAAVDLLPDDIRVVQMSWLFWEVHVSVVV